MMPVHRGDQEYAPLGPFQEEDSASHPPTHKYTQSTMSWKQNYSPIAVNLKMGAFWKSFLYFQC